jgi:hypothetical protein
MVEDYASRTDLVASADAGIAALETEIAGLQAKLFALKRTRNALTPLCRLPNEILGLILLHVHAPSPLAPFTSKADVMLTFTRYKRWEQAILSCTRMYELAMSTPVWPVPRIREYLYRAGSFPLTVVWGYPGEGSWPGDIWMAVALACTCMERSRAINIIFKDTMPHVLLMTSRIMKQRAPSLKALHLSLDSHLDASSDLLQSLELYPALTELHITNAIITTPLYAQLPLLTDLHLDNINTDQCAESIISLLHHTPCLKDFYFGIFPENESEDDGMTLDAPGHDLELPFLDTIIGEASPRFMSSFLRSLSLRAHRLDFIYLEVSPYMQDDEADFRFLEAFQEMSKHWRAMTKLPLLSARWSWEFDPSHFPYSNIDLSLSHMKTRSQCGSERVMNQFDANAHYVDNHETFYREHGLNVLSIEIVQLPRHPINEDPLLTWSSKPDKIVSNHAPNLRDLTF